MKFSILFTILISFSVLSVTAQNSGLQFTKFKSHKTKYIKEDSKIRIRLNNGGIILNGKFTSLNDSTIVVQSDTIGLKQIYEIHVKPFPVILAGVSLLGVGTFFTAVGINTLISIAADLGGGGFILGLVFLSPVYLGGAILATSGIIFLVHGKKYASSKWQYKIVKPVPVANSNSN